MSDPIEEALSLMVDCAERAAALEALAVLRGESADYSSLRRELRTIYGEGQPRKGESWPAYYLRLIADDRAAAYAEVAVLRGRLAEAERERDLAMSEEVDDA
jgi:hypothetical protein